MPPKKGRPQARGLARREQILETAFALFATNGHQSTSIAEIAEAVGITDAGVIHHFPTKEALLLAVLEWRDRPDPDAESHAAEPGGGLDSLRRLPVFADVLLRRPLLMRFDSVVGGESLREAGPVQDHFRNRMAMVREGVGLMIRIGVERGEFRADVDVDAIAEQINAFMAGIQYQWLLDPDAIDLRRAYEHYVEVLVDHLVPTP